MNETNIKDKSSDLEAGGGCCKKISGAGDSISYGAGSNEK